MIVYILTYLEPFEYDSYTHTEGVYSKSGMERRKREIIEDKKQETIKIINALKKEIENNHLHFKEMIIKSENFLSEEKKYSDNKHSQEYKEIHKKRIALLKQANEFRRKNIEQLNWRLKKYEDMTDEIFWNSSEYSFEEEYVLD